MPALTFATLQTELSDRGFDQLSSTRLGYLINQARSELDNMYKWPYRMTTASGAAPLTITDLGQIEEVIDTANSNYPLTFRDHAALRTVGADFATTGTPQYYWVDNGIVRTYPVGGTLSVRYFKRTPDLTGVQVPLAPADYHMLIVDLACRWGQKDGEQPASLEADIQRQIGMMVADLFGQHGLGPSQVLPMGWQHY